MARVARIVGLLASGVMACSCAGAEEPSAPDGGARATSWQQVFTDLDGALISVWGRSSKDVWAVGSDTGQGAGALILHYDGEVWERHVIGLTRDLWWVHGASTGTTFFGGTEGTIVRRVENAYEVMPTPSTPGTVFGVWAASENDAWAVGGDFLRGTGAFVWRYDGSTWTPVSLPGAADVRGYYKVWGSAADDVWVSGTGGSLLHFDGSAWEALETGVVEPLFTVHTTADGRAASVGGFDLGVLVERDGAGAWSSAALPPGTRSLFGVWLAPEGGYSVGADATVLTQRGSAWERVETGLSTDKTFHAVWVDETAGVWAVGGEVQAPPLELGVLAHYGVGVADTFSEVTHALGRPDASVAPGGREAGADASPPFLDAGPVDGGGDAGPVDAGTDGRVEAGPVTPPREVGSIYCGGAPCAVGSQQCCLHQTGAEPAQCIDTGQLCPPGFYPSTCDQRDDCAAGEVCCLEVYFQGGGVASVSCKTSCSTHELCATFDECLGTACVPLFFLPEYNECL